jgi:outer membrane protein assembly factor BamB
MVYSFIGTDFCLLDGDDGSLVWQAPVPAPYWGACPASAFADLDLDGYPEIVSCAGDNDIYVMDAADGTIKWSTQVTSHMYSSPCVLDLDDNDSLEIVVGVFDINELQAYTCAGEIIWTAPVPNQPIGTPAVADIDGDQTLELIQTSAYPNGAIQILDAQTGAVEWTQTYTYYASSSPAIGDLDGDGYYDFVYSTHDGYIYAYKVNPQGIEQGSVSLPLSISVSPNPFISDVSISFELPETGYVSIGIYDLAGRYICTLEESELGPGNRTYVWNGSDDVGRTVPGGLYVCRIQFDGMIETRNLCKLR